jgi:predicted outer membrane repeat protein
MNTRIFKATLLIPILAVVFQAKSALAAGVVGNGTPASCTEAAFTSALVGGGTVTFKCGGAHTLLLTSPKTISVDTTVEGGYNITLSGGGKTNLFQVTSSGRLILAGITLDQGFTNQDGGAIVSHGGLILSRVTISNSAAGSSAHGGAIFTDGATTIIENNSTFTHNTAGFGGALYVLSPSARVQVTGGSFTNNTAGADGGAVYVGSDKQFTATDTVFTSNSATLGGAIYAEVGSTVALTGTPAPSPTASPTLVLNYNTATTAGGAIYSDGAALTIDEALFQANSVPSANLANVGGAITSFGTLTLTRSQLSTNSSMRGGAIMVGGDRHISVTAWADIESTVFFANAAQDNGGGVCIAGFPTVLVSGSSFDTNEASHGGGVGRFGGQLTIQKSSFTFNASDRGGAGIYLTQSAFTPPDVRVQNVTFSLNMGVGAAVYNDGADVELYSDTMAGNNTSENVYTTANGNTRFRDTVLSNSGSNCTTVSGGTTSDDGANFVTDFTCHLPNGWQGPGLDPRLGPLTKDPNGVTWFMRPSGGSPLIDKGVDCPATDQIGVPPFGASCDVGATEYQGINTGNGGLTQ